jgi:hypothetical protein
MALLLGVNRCESEKNQALAAPDFRACPWRPAPRRNALFIRVLRDFFKQDERVLERVNARSFIHPVQVVIQKYLKTLLDNGSH